VDLVVVEDLQVQLAIQEVQEILASVEEGAGAEADLLIFYGVGVRAVRDILIQDYLLILLGGRMLVILAM
jgi:hypothetical protein